MQVFRWCVLVLALVVLTSVGGLGVATAPLFVPLLLVLGVTADSSAFRAASTVVVSLTVAEIAWVVSAQLAPNTAAVAFLPLALGLTAVLASWRVQNGRRSGTRRVSTAA